MSSDSGELKVQNAPLMTNEQQAALRVLLGGFLPMMQGTTFGQPYPGPTGTGFQAKSFQNPSIIKNYIGGGTTDGSTGGGYKKKGGGGGGGSGGGGGGDIDPGTGGPKLPPGTCFTAGTMVRMADGSSKKIEDIKIGDIVHSYDLENMVHVNAEVSEVFHHGPEEAKAILVINDSLGVTPDHLIFVYGVWIPAGNLKIGDMLRRSDDTTDEVHKIEWRPGQVPTFNIHTKDEPHTYFANDILVHNAKKKPEEPEQLGLPAGPIQTMQKQPMTPTQLLAQIYTNPLIAGYTQGMTGNYPARKILAGY